MRPRRLLAACAVLVLGVVAGCATQPEPEPTRPKDVDLPPAPPYAEVAARYNRRLGGLTQLRGSAVVRIDYPRDNGERDTAQGDGLLQFIGPDRLALDLRKASTTLFWLGSDPSRYWWFDLTGDTRAAFVGTHDRFDPEVGGRLGIVVAPRDLIRLIGITPLPVGEQTPKGVQTVRSRDGSLVGVITPIGEGGRQRLWLDPADAAPRQIELLDAAGTPTIIARIEKVALVETTRGGDLPRIPGRTVIYHPQSRSMFTLDVGDLTDGTGRLSPKSFSFDDLVKTFHPDRTIDLDERSRRRAEPR